MTAEKVRDVLAIYRKKFEELGVVKGEFQSDQIFYPLFSQSNILAHCNWMLDEMERFLDKGRMDKVFRWLGFIQGCLWSTGIYSITEMKDHNRQDPDSFNP